MQGLAYGDLLDLQLAKDAVDVQAAKLRTIEEEIKRLKQEEANVFDDYYEIYEDFERMLVARCSPQLGELMVLLDEKLPRELRDMVYGYLSISGHRIHLNPPPGTKGPTDTWIPHLHHTLFRSYYVNRSVAYEIPEFYWSNNTFEYDCVPGIYSTLYHALTVRIFDRYPYYQGLGSPYQKIQHLRVNLRCEKWDKCHRCHGLIDPKPPFCTVSTGHEMQDLEAKIQDLRQFEGQKQAHIEFVIHTTLPKIWEPWENVQFPGIRHWLNILESIRTIVFTLKHSGVRVTVIISNTPPETLSREEENIISSEFRSWREDWDLTPHLLLSADDWAKEVNHVKYVQNLYLSKASFAADPEEVYIGLERRWGLRRPLPWSDSLSLEGYFDPWM